MFVVKENLKFGEAYLTHTAAVSAEECFFILAEEYTTEDITLLNAALKERYGIVIKENMVLPVYEITELKAGVWKCGKCFVCITQGAEAIADYSFFTVKNKDGDIMGSLFRQDVDAIAETMRLLDRGGCPLCEGWQDGIGNICSPSGWGKTLFFFKDCKHI